MTEDSLALVFIFALITALATGLGALPLAWVRQGGSRLRAFGSAAAMGLMVAASIQLLYEGVHHGLAHTLAGLAIGGIFMIVTRRLLPDHEGWSIGVLQGADARKAVLFVGVMTLHSTAEGVGVGVAFGAGLELGLLMTAAIALHNVPEGLAIALVLVPRGVSVRGAAGWSVVSSLPQPILAVPAFAFVAVFTPLLPLGLGAAAGAMIWMALAEMLPDARRSLDDGAIAACAVVAGGLLLALGWLVVHHH